MKTTILCTIFLLVQEICVARKEVDYKRLAMCPEYKNNTVFFQNVIFIRDKKGKSVSMRFSVVFKKEVKRLMVVVTLQKCENSENLDSCEYYMKDFKINNVCDIIGKQNQVWSDTLSRSNFPRSCPIPPGTYRLNDTDIRQDSQLTLMPIPVALWKTRFYIYDSGNANVMVCCVNMEVKVYNSRN